MVVGPAWPLLLLRVSHRRILLLLLLLLLLLSVGDVAGRTVPFLATLVRPAGFNVLPV
jgi:hypothetical protein